MDGLAGGVSSGVAFRPDQTFRLLGVNSIFVSAPPPAGTWKLIDLSLKRSRKTSDPRLALLSDGMPPSHPSILAH
ncbi:Hypothetical protein NTJ_14489 [Nesidiocoris tenuis]|uniref:Uncharacterized protein n=1 Tax=Nesidiocoris tenuis TaxID=355587 RepID=A0ABN7BDB5_9HEMI|nr:Hypothetical protein NTJ_14489 [Nesidiocoris tenuis]